MEELLTIILNVTKYIARWCRLGRSCHRISKLTLVTPDLNASYSATEKLSSMRGLVEVQARSLLRTKTRGATTQPP